MNIYLFILLFGLFLVLYAIKSLWVTKKKIKHNVESSSKIKAILAVLRSHFSLWKFYFVKGEPKNIYRNIIYIFVLFLISFYINNTYLKFNKFFFLFSYVLLVYYTVWFLGKRRNKKVFNETFPEVLQVLSASTSSGGGILQGIERCGKDVSGELGVEFKNIYRRLSIGEDINTVFNDIYFRYPYKELYFFIITIKTNIDKGGQIKEIISRLSRVIANSNKMEKKKKSMTSEARMSAFIVGALPVIFFIIMRFMMPENFDFVINNPDGRWILYYTVGSELFGMGIIWWLMRSST